ncbi:hypothetical protein SDC9_165937 [bioreactor metagenome]|uniref:Uncharacterized protein n=1 Tax=bioreactor metagenome TaxID=1076179 RepID=A0A645FVU7_9ZZZZ
MDLINEKDDAAVALLHFFQYRFQAFLKFSAVLGSRNQRAHIQRKDRFILKVVRHVFFHDPLGQPFHDSSLADTRFSDQDRIVFGFARQNADNIPDLFIPADNRILFPAPYRLHKIYAIFFQGFILIFLILRSHALSPSHVLYFFGDHFFRQALFFQEFGQRMVFQCHQAQKHRIR